MMSHLSLCVGIELVTVTGGTKLEDFTEMACLTDTLRCVLIGDKSCGKEMMMKKYADIARVPYDSTSGHLATVFNGRKCVFVDSSIDDGVGVPHVFLLCVSIARQANVEKTVNMILDTVVDRIRDAPFILVGTQIEKRLLTRIDLNMQDDASRYLPMPWHRAEAFAKRIGAIKYMECSEVTGEGLDEVFEDAFQIGSAYLLEKTKRLQRRKNGSANMCITQ